MRARVIGAAMAGVTVSLTALAVPASATDFQRMTVQLHREQRSAVDLGAPGPSTADVASATGTVSSAGKGRGAYTWMGITVVADAVAGTETRQSTLVLALAKGSITLQAVHASVAGGLPSKAFDYVIVGGTRGYAGIRGEATYAPLTPVTEARVTLRYTLD